ncbi:MAG: DUF1571 domain-containing protein [Pirellulales bacterium]|nr:DUF1571 domain-containing protein [Pirellulales bacterium]
MKAARALICLGMFALAGSLCATRAAAEHPVEPLIRFAEARLESLDREIQDYTCTLVKRERIDGRLSPYENMFLKLRHEQIVDGKVAVPFSVYLQYLAPAELKGREVIYVHGHNKGKIIARRGGKRFAYVTTSVAPDSELALRGNHYPVTNIGMKNLIRRLLEVGRDELAYDECKVEYLDGAQLNGRSCLVVQVTHPIKRDHFRYHMARIFIDKELMLPIRYASYDWPETEGSPPPLIEEYNHVDVKLNVGLSNRDFDHRNPAYQFRKTFEP